MENAKKKLEELELEDSIRFASSKRLILKWLVLCAYSSYRGSRGQIH